MSKVFALRVKGREGDMMEHELTLNGEPYRIRVEGHMQIDCWRCYYGGTTIILPLPWHLVSEVRAAEAFVANYAILPNHRLRRSIHRLIIDNGQSLLGLCKEPIESGEGVYAFDVDLSRVVTGPKLESQHSIRFKADVTQV